MPGRPAAGLQVPTGGVLAGEPLEEAVRREVAEETGLTDVTVRTSLGVSRRPHPQTGAARVTAFYYATTGDPRDGWEHAVSGDGEDRALRFDCYFLPLSQVAGSLADRQDEFIPGLLREAALARWAHEELRIARVELHVEPWNAGSIKAAETAGFRREGLLRGWQEIGGERRDLLLYARLDGDLVRTGHGTFLAGGE